MTSDIQWLTDEHGRKGVSWNVVTGCTPKSSGCLRCYAAVLASRQMSDGHVGLTVKKKRRNDAGKLVSLPVFNGKLSVHPERLSIPLRMKKPRRIFVNSMSDLFHEDLPFELVAAMYGVMAACPQHTFLILTKRDPRPFFAWLHAYGDEHGMAHDYVPWFLARDVLQRPFERVGWPLPNVHLGVSAENQETFDERTAILREVPSAIPWVSYEPALDAVDASSALDFLRWIVVGGESGAGARPFEVAWARTIVQQCEHEGVPVFVKQLGSRPVHNDRRVPLGDKSGGDIHEWTGPLASLAVRQLPR